jgi:hypothetical protein
LGEIQGDGVIAKIHKDSDSFKSLFDSLESTKDALIYYSNDEQCLNVAELSTSSDQNVPYKITLIKVAA